MTRPYDQTLKDNHKLCSRCGEIANPTDAWYYGWPVAGQMTLKHNSVIHWTLCKNVSKEATKRDTKDPLVRAVSDGTHPVIKKEGSQQIDIEWGHDKKYRLCLDCQRKLIEMVGEFFFTNVPPDQPIQSLPEHDFIKQEKEIETDAVDG